MDNIILNPLKRSVLSVSRKKTFRESNKYVNPIGDLYKSLTNPTRSVLGSELAKRRIVPCQ